MLTGDTVIVTVTLKNGTLLDRVEIQLRNPSTMLEICDPLPGLTNPLALDTLQIG